MDTLLTELKTYLTQESDTLIIVSNASMDHTINSAFAWTIATPHKTLWTGIGTVPCKKTRYLLRQS